MGSLFTSMVSTAGAMRALQRSLSVVQNNIVNASTVGYARQEGSLIASPFNPNSGSTSGGVRSGPTLTSRDAFVEASVWKMQHRSGFADNLSTKLTEIERTFPLTAGSGISGEMDKFFATVSQWSVSPNNSVARRQVLDRAGTLAQSFNQAALDLGDAAGRAGAELSTTVEKINRLTTDIVGLNRLRRENATTSGDAGLDASLHAKLEELSQYVDFTALPQEDGSVSVFLGGQTAAVIGDHGWPISLSNAGGEYQLLDSEGVDITKRLQEGKIGALLQFRNTLLPDYQTRLSTLAQGFADNVNNTLNAGIDQNGVAPTKNLFSYNATIGAAATLAITDITGSELAAAAAGDPGGNTNALNLADLQTTGLFSGLTPAQFYAELTSNIGDRLNTEQNNGDLQRQLLLQAQNVRAELSGVDINVEATKLLQLQKGFEASGQVMSVLNSITETLISMLR
ncbi:MAG: flagellar hook-associated protein FlgK [Bryobacterales bacterium]|nr:flagellar hook-associated protein FlgK [Bryobacterales bacterium]